MPSQNNNYRWVYTPRLQELRKQNNITQAELAQLCGTTQATISRFDKSSRHDDWLLFKLAEILKCEIKDLFVAEYKKI